MAMPAAKACPHSKPRFPAPFLQILLSLVTLLLGRFLEPFLQTLPSLVTLLLGHLPSHISLPKSLLKVSRWQRPLSNSRNVWVLRLWKQHGVEFNRRARPPAVRVNPSPSRFKRGLGFICTDLSIVSSYKRNAAWCNMSCLCGCKLTAFARRHVSLHRDNKVVFWTPTKRRQWADSFRRPVADNQLWQQ